MAEYRTIRMAFWTDPYIEGLPAEGKLIYVYLFTSPHTNNLGVLEISRPKIAFETGITVLQVDEYMAQLERDGKVITDGLKIWLTRFIKHQTSTSPKITQALRKLLPCVDSESLHRAICEHYPHIFEDSAALPCGTQKAVQGGDTLSIPHADGTNTVGILSGELEVEKEVEVEKEINISVGPDVPTDGSLPQALTMPVQVVEARPQKKFPPTVEEVAAYIAEKGYAIDPEMFHAHYESCNWMRGKTKITKWKACIATWKNNLGNGTGRYQSEAERLHRDPFAGVL